MKKNIFCRFNFHTFTYEYLQYSTFRFCKRCGIKQYFNCHPAAEVRWPEMNADREKELREVQKKSDLFI